MSFFKRKFIEVLSEIPHGTLTIHDKHEQHKLGQSSSLTANLFIHNQHFYKDFLWGGPNAIAKGYIQKHWSTDSLDKIFDLYLNNIDYWKKFEKKVQWLFSAIKHKLNYNHVKNARKNIHAHYDLGNDFFQYLLDPSMMYSCAYFDEHTHDLEQASLNKCKIIAKKLQLSPQDHLLEIGSGWGTMAIFAAKHYHCRVTTITISKKQYEYCVEKVKKLKLEHKIDIKYLDYRNLTGHYDKIVSIEMIEAVGYEYFKTYFRTIDYCLRPGGLALIQAITIRDQDYHRAKYEMDFIKEFIFPGGCLPSTADMLHNTSKYTNLQLRSLEDIGEHYCLTLSAWLNKFQNNFESIKKLGFDHAFYRMWEYYLIYCRSGFKSKHISCAHYLWEK